jgi:hypothetical protein
VRPSRAIRRKWRILDEKVGSDLMSDSELQGGSPRLCQLRIASVVPVTTNIELCTDAYMIYGVACVD